MSADGGRVRWPTGPWAHGLSAPRPGTSPAIGPSLDCGPVHRRTRCSRAPSPPRLRRSQRRARARGAPPRSPPPHGAPSGHPGAARDPGCTAGRATLVAPLAEQRPDPTGRVVVVQVSWTRRATDGTRIALLFAQGIDLSSGQAVAPLPVGLAAGRAIATETETAEAGGLPAVPRVVLVRHGLLAAGTPAETVRDPRVVTDGPTHRLSGAAVPLAVALTIALQAVERQPVRQHPVLAEGLGGLALTTVRTALHLTTQSSQLITDRPSERTISRTPRRSPPAPRRSRRGASRRRR